MEEQGQSDNDDPLIIELENMPTLVLENIVGFLDYATRRTCRLVSSQFKTYVDSGRLVVSNNLKLHAENGLSLKIDSRQPASLKLCRKVVVTEAHVLFLKGEVSFKRFHLENWKTAIFSGPIDTKWFFDSLLRNCSNLHFLMLRGDCLVAQDFVSPKSLPVFQHLTEMHIIVNDEIIFGALNKLGPFRNEQARNKILMKLDGRVQKNLGCVLKTIRSRVLKVLYVMVMVDFKYTAGEQVQVRKGRWEHEPLFEFIQAHCNSLQEFLSPGYFFNEAPLPQSSYRIPVNLKLFSVGCESLCTSKKAYWKDLILAQTSLEQLSLRYIKEDAALFSSFLRTITSNSAHTLTKICLEFAKALPSLDMKIFKHCESITSLSIDTEDEKWTMVISNLNSLPRSRLQYLKLTYVRIGSDFNGLEFLKDFHPITFALVTISTEGLFGEARHVAQFVRTLLHCRTLNFLLITLDYTSFPFEGQIRTIVKLDEDGLDRWFSSIETEPEPQNRSTVESDRLYFHNLLILDLAHLRSTSNPSQSLGTYTEAPGAGFNLDYLTLTARREMMGTVEQPYHIPRNAESYSIWMNTETNACRFLPNYKTYTLRIGDIKTQIKFGSNFILELKNR